MALIEVRDVSKVYRRDAMEIPVLANVSISVPEGDFLGLMGPSGSGKSTLLNLLAGIDRPTRGTIHVGGTDITRLSERALASWRAQNIGFIFQLYNLIPVLNAFENVELPLLLTNLTKKQRREHVLTALNIVGLGERAQHYPRQLSGGQEQRVAIARAIVTDPVVLLADEPTGDLDAKSAGEVLTLLQRLNTEFKKTIVLVTHDPHAAERTRRVLHLEKGTFVEQGATECGGELGNHKEHEDTRTTKHEITKRILYFLVFFVTFVVQEIMKFLSLVFKSARRSKRRTALTVLSVAIAVFLFASLRAVIDGFNAGAEASSSTRIVTQRSTSLFFAMPISHAEAIKEHPRRAGRHLGELVRRRLQGSAEFLRAIRHRAGELSPHVSGNRAHARGEAGVPRRPHRLHRRRRAGPELRVQGRRQDHAAGRHPELRHAGTSTSPSAPSTGRAARTVDTQSMFFHWKYADERSDQKGLAGWYIAQIANPDQAAQVSGAIDQKFANSPFETKTDTEKAFQATFVSMFGNINLLLGSIALAVVITTLFVAGNTMAMSVRERTMEIAVMRTLGFQSATIFLLIAGEGLLMALGGGLLGALLARLLVNPGFFPSGGFIPEITVNNTNMAIGVGLSAVIGIVAGLIPATMASRLKIVDALRRVA